MDSTTAVERVYPTPEELCKSLKGLKCSECAAVFRSDSNLNLHLAKTHKKAELLQQQSRTVKAYHCPVITCRYHNASHFKEFKVLKQHYLKMHSEKDFNCTLCNKGFPTESYRDRHMDYCSTTFKCCDCDALYTCYETLKTHCRRKKHNILEKSAYKVGQGSLKGPKSETSINTLRLLLPKVSQSTGMLVVSDTSEQSSQTDRGKTTLFTQETQTLGLKMKNMTVETQTIGDYYSKKSEIMNDLKCSKTQTNLSEPKSVSCNTSFNINELDLGLNEVQRSSSSTQTNIVDFHHDLTYSSSTSTHDSIHTDTSDLLTDTLDYLNCNMETQTDFMFNDELFKYCDYYSNMYTQTCGDLLLGEIGLNDTHTQTVFDDVLKSVESQTVMSQSRRVSLSCKDTSPMETQTDFEYKQILEEINA